MKRLLLLVVTLLAACGHLAAPSPFGQTSPLQPGDSWVTPDPAAYHTTATVAVVSLQAGTITELPLVPVVEVLPPVTFGGLQPEPDPCIVVVKREGEHQVASLQGNNCQKSLIWLDIKRGDVLVAAFGITIDNQVIASGDVEISREDGGLIVHEIGAEVPPRGANGLNAWST